jgi:segregation and condensation protein A
MSSANTEEVFYNNVQVLDVVDDVINFEDIMPQKDREFDAIEILVDLAKSGKIDPWNIDIVDIYDKYILRLAQLKANNLKLAGRALLFAAILLKLKSNILKGINVLDFHLDDEGDEFLDDGFEDSFEGEQMKLPSNNVISFEEVLQRRTSTRLNHSRNVTLKDLIRHLQFYEELEKKRALQSALDKQKRRVRSYSKLSANDIKNLAHEEYIEELVEKMQQNLVKIFEHEEKIELTELSLLGFDRTSAYIAVLFLSVRDKYEIVQDEFYGNLYVKKSTQESVSSAD